MQRCPVMAKARGGDPLISVSAAAKKINVNKSTLSRQIADGSIRSHAGKVRLSEVIADRLGNLDQTRTREGEAVSGAESLLKARTVKETFTAKLRQLEYQIKSGEVVEANAVRARVFDLARRFRDNLTNWPSQSAPLIAAEIGCDSVALAIAMEKHVRDFLTAQSEPDV